MESKIKYVQKPRNNLKNKIRNNKRFELTYKLLQWETQKNNSRWVRYSCWHKTLRKYKAARLLLTKII